MEDETMQAVESVPQEETEGTATAAAEPAEETADALDTTPKADEVSEVQPITIPIQFNHESRELSLEEAKALAQKGMKFDELTPTFEKIKYLATVNGKSVNEMVDALVESQEKQHYQSILDECDGNETLARRLYEAEKSQRQAKYESSQKEEEAAAQKEKDDLAKKLADEFLKLREEIPDIAQFQDLPQSVVDMAVKKNLSLMDAYLRYQYIESKKTSAAKAAQESAAKASPGSQAAGAGETTDPTIDAMLAGVWGK